jgi:serine/threonine protein kinase
MRPQISNAQYIRFLQNDTILGRYKVINEIGVGSLGIVYRCFDNVNNIEVAVKALCIDVSHSKTSMENIFSSFEKVLSLHHPNIASLYSLEFDQDTGDYFFVSELVVGFTVSEWLEARHRRNSPLTIDEIVILARHIASALDYAHSQDVCHCHLSPENIRITENGSVKVLDFLSVINRPDSSNPSQITSAYYYSPELWQGHPFSPASDQYALATIIYEIVTEGLPFDSSDFSDFLVSVDEESPLAIDGIPDYTNSALIKALSKDSKARYLTCIAFIDALEGKSVLENRENGDSESRPLLSYANPNDKTVLEPVAHRRTQKLFFLVSAAFIALLLSVGLYYIYQSRQEDRRNETLRNEALRNEALRKEKIVSLTAIGETALNAENLDGIPSTISQLKNLDAPLESASLQSKYDSKIDEIEVRKRYAAASFARDKITKLNLSQEFSGQLEALELLWREGEAARHSRAWKAALKSYTSFCSSNEDLLNKVNLADELKYTTLLQHAESALMSKDFAAVADCSIKMLALKPNDKRAKEFELVVNFETLADEGNRIGNHSLVYSVAVKLLSVMPDYPRALGLTGLCYAKGQGITKDATQAVIWFRKAAEQGDVKAQNNLGVCYEEGEGVIKDTAKAVIWYSKAAEKGDADAIVNLGVCYYNGAGVSKDVSKAVALLKNAASKGDESAKKLLDEHFEQVRQESIIQQKEKEKTLVSSRPPITLEKVKKDIVGKSTDEQNPWKFSVRERREITPLEAQYEDDRATLYINVVSNNDNEIVKRGRWAGKLRLHYEWISNEWILMRIENLTFREIEWSYR